MDSHLIETLLHMSEGDALDFKEAQYPLAGATDEQKSELVKDIVALANAWRSSDAFIVIGVREAKGARADVRGVAQHLDDAHVQQLVGSKLNAPIRFQYLAVSVDDKSIGVIRVDRAQSRPLYLTRDFGNLKSKIVYVRRGSSTTEATPEEIASMGAADVRGHRVEPSIAVEFADPVRRSRLGTKLRVASKLLGEDSRSSGVHAPALTARSLERFRPSDEELFGFKRDRALLAPVRIWAANSSGITAQDVQFKFSVPKRPGLIVCDEDDVPKKPNPLDFGRGPVRAFFNDLVVGDDGDVWNVRATFKKLQPRAEACTSFKLFIGSKEPAILELEGRVFADNLAEPVTVPLRIHIETEVVASFDVLDDESD